LIVPITSGIVQFLIPSPLSKRASVVIADMQNKVAMLGGIACIVAWLLVLATANAPADPQPYPNGQFGSVKTHQQVIDIVRSLQSSSSSSSSSSATRSVDDNVNPYSTHQAAADGADEHDAQVEHFRIERTVRGQFLSGHLWLLHNPINHFSIYEPTNGCGHRVKVSDTASEHECIVATNAGFFDTHNGDCHGNLVSDSRLVQNTGQQNGISSTTAH
jgi:hypothetical protein